MSERVREGGGGRKREGMIERERERGRERQREREEGEGEREGRGRGEGVRWQYYGICFQTIVECQKSLFFKSFSLNLDSVWGQWWSCLTYCSSQSTGMTKRCLSENTGKPQSSTYIEISMHLNHWSNHPPIQFLWSGYWWGTGGVSESVERKDWLRDCRSVHGGVWEEEENNWTHHFSGSTQTVISCMTDIVRLFK